MNKEERLKVTFRDYPDNDPEKEFHIINPGRGKWKLSHHLSNGFELVGFDGECSIVILHLIRWWNDSPQIQLTICFSNMDETKMRQRLVPLMNKDLVINAMLNELLIN